MDPEAEALLLDGLADAGARGGRRGAGHAGSRGGAFGARLGARLVSTRTHERAAELELDPGAAAEVFSDIIEHLGRMVRGDIAPGGMRAALRGVIGTGALALNPAVVDVVLEPRPGGGTLATVHTAAKEGLIPQRSAQKAAEKLLETYGLATATPS